MVVSCNLNSFLKLLPQHFRLKTIIIPKLKLEIKNKQNKFYLHHTILFFILIVFLNTMITVEKKHSGFTAAYLNSLIEDREAGVANHLREEGLGNRTIPQYPGVEHRSYRTPRTRHTVSKQLI